MSDCPLKSAHIFLVVKRVTHVEKKTMSAICFSPLVRQLSGAFLGSQVFSIYFNNCINSLGKILPDLPLFSNSSFSPHLPTFWGPPQWLGDLCSVECQHLHLLGLQWYSYRQLHIYLCSVMCRFAISAVLITEAPLWGRAGDSWGGGKVWLSHMTLILI